MPFRRYPLDPTRAQAALIENVTTRFAPAVLSRLETSGLVSEAGIVMNEIRYQAWSAAINSPTPNVEQYVIGTLRSWIRTYLTRYARRLEYTVSIESRTTIFDAPIHPLETHAEYQRFTRLVSHLSIHLGEDTVENLLHSDSGNGRVYRRASGRIQRVTRIVLAACDLAERTAQDNVVAGVDEIGEHCLDEEDKQLLTATRELVADERGVTDVHAVRLIRRARAHHRIAVSVYRTEMKHD